MNSLSSRYVKMTALQGTFSATQNIVSFSIPAGQKIDLSETTVLVDLGITGPDANAAALPIYDGVAGIYSQAITFNDGDTSDTVLKPVAYVQNADIRCERVGAIENLRAINTLRLALDIYQEDLETKQDEQYFGGGNSDGVGGFNGTPFRDLNRSGTIKSRNRNATLRIPLKDIFDVANTPVWDTNKYGRTDIKLEMAFDALFLKQTMGATDGNWTNVNLGNAGGGGATYGAIDVFTFNNGGAVGADGLDVVTLRPSRLYNHPESVNPFWVGQKLLISFTVTNDGGAAVPTTRERTITGITFNNGDDNKLLLNLSSKIELVQNDVVTAVSCVGVNVDASAAIVFNRCELEMKQVNDPTPPSIEYTTYSTEEDSGFGAAQVNINKQYTCEGNADTLVVCALGTGKQNPTIKINASRITIDSKQETPEKVVGRERGAGNVGQANPLYYDRIDRTYFNMGDSVSCMVEAQLGFSSSLQTNPTKLASALLNPLPLKASPKQVQLDLDYTAGEIQKLILYKRMVKTI